MLQVDPRQLTAVLFGKQKLWLSQQVTCSRVSRRLYRNHAICAESVTLPCPEKMFRAQPAWSEFTKDHTGK